MSCAERAAPWPLSSYRGPARIHKSFQLTRRCQADGRAEVEEGEEGRKRERGKLAVGFRDHFAVTHIPPFCSEFLNMKTTQLLLTPAPPPQHSGSD